MEFIQKLGSFFEDETDTSQEETIVDEFFDFI